MPKVKQQKVEAVAPPPAPSTPASEVQAAPTTPDEATGDAGLKQKRKGRSGLRIPLDANVGGSATGLNIPLS
jgi:hypothetical protein